MKGTKYMENKIQIKKFLTYTPPWFHILIDNEKIIKDLQKMASNFNSVEVIIIEGKKCKTKRFLLEEFSKKLEFPDYFGNNWDAFDECITDLEWLPADHYIVVIKNAINILSDDEKELDNFVKILNSTVEYMATRSKEHSAGSSVSFHMIFLCESENGSLLNRIHNLNSLEIILSSLHRLHAPSLAKSTNKSPTPETPKTVFPK